MLVSFLVQGEREKRVEERELREMRYYYGMTGGKRDQSTFNL